MDGVARCTRYAFGPNRLHLCGPDMNREVLGYMEAGETDQGLVDILREFQTLYPYLHEIASANNIRDPFDTRVIEAYWLGNELLDDISAKIFYGHLVGNLQIKKRLNSNTVSYLENKISQGAQMSHCFHVFNVWRKTGNIDEMHTLESMDNCRVSWGEVVGLDGPVLTVLRRPLVQRAHKLFLGSALNTKIVRSLESSSVMDEVKIGDKISIHWGVPCEILNERQVSNLEKYTLKSIALANLTM
ncbi:hypothetical protein KJ937_01730 [Patescibacteria group bacterium]|nr:hypothetical protein [Patescibacteria group bacterium]